ncbi:hypothetical protein [Paenibacillus sp. B2(2019)]|uniref:hypothetical protein n=1 Tax=Paenibacillus sp. B2(2019) TaxID=2607754 RepID=UPI001CB6D3AE|nr:hypothetical protein [Paenibacillus sp. B2(2019)]
MSSDMCTSVRRQEHSPIEIRAGRRFFILSVQVLVLCSGQELVPIADNGQEHVTIADLIGVYFDLLNTKNYISAGNNAMLVGTSI